MAEAKRVATKGDVTKACCALALLFFARVATAQNAAPPVQTAPAAEKTAAGPPAISYAGGQLSINALDSTLAAVLTKVASLTGVKIDLPDGASSERMPVVELGPGPARQILASLLSDSGFDYLIQASDADPEKIQSVLLMPREKKASGTNATEAAALRPPRSPYSRGMAPSVRQEEAPAPDPAPADNVAAEPVAFSRQPAPVQPDSPPPMQPDLSGQFPLLQPDPSNPTRPGALTPPQALSPQSINQQLQQMYQQRAQMTQQDHVTGTQPVSVPGVR